MEEKKTSVEMKKFMALTNLRHAGFIDDAVLKTAVQEKKISEETLIQALTQDKIAYLYESAAMVLSDMDGTDITPALMSAALPAESEIQKMIAKIAMKRPDYAEVKKRLLKAI